MRLVTGFYLVILLVARLLLATDTADAHSSRITASHSHFYQQLTKSTFASTSSGNWLILFYTPSCVHCKNFLRSWEPFVQQQTAAVGGSDISWSEQNNFYFGKVNCAQERPLCHDAEIKFVPTVKFFVDGEYVRTLDSSARKSNAKLLQEFVDQVTSQRTKVISDVEGQHGKSKKIASTINPKGMSVPLSMDTFQSFVAGQDDIIFVRFYSSKSKKSHAIQSLWSQFASEMQNKLNVGHYNCDKEQALCLSLQLSELPSAFLFRGFRHTEYKDLWQLDKLIRFANLAREVGPRGLENDQELETLLEKHDVLVLYFYDEATVSEDFRALDKVALELVDHAPFLKTNSAALAEKYKVNSFPSLIAIRNGRKFDFKAVTPAHIRDPKAMLRWLLINWHPLTSELTTHNARDLFSDALVVLLITSPNDPDFSDNKKILLEEAVWHNDYLEKIERLELLELREKKEKKVKQAKKKGDKAAVERIRAERVEVKHKEPARFAWIDQKIWSHWCRTLFGTSSLEGNRILIVDYERKRYWDVSKDGQPLRFDTLQESLKLLNKSPSNLRYRQFQNLKGYHTLDTVKFLAILILVAVLARKYYQKLKDAFGSVHAFNCASGSDVTIHETEILPKAD